MNRIETFLIVLFLVFTSILADIQIAHSNEAPDLHRRANLDTLKAVLQSDGFQITPGEMFQLDVLKLACAGILASCNGNNNTNPYLVASVPSAGSQYNPADPALNFIIRQDEAIVLIGRTPPPVNYFSFRSFIFDRYIERESVRRKLFGSLGDPNNMLTINTIGTAKGNPYDKPFVLMVVSDKGTESRIRNALATAGYPNKIINTDVISPNLAKMSSKENGDSDIEKDDTFVMIYRLAMWDYGYEAAGQAYLLDPPITVLRLTPEPRTPKTNYSPLPVERLRPRGTGFTELDMLPEVEALRKAIVGRYPKMKVEDIRPTTWLEESFVAFQKDLDVLGESRDTVYLRNEGTISLADDEFIVVFGVNHEATGKATYANFAAYDVCKSCPVAGENSHHYTGSAIDYFPDVKTQPTHINNLYAWKMALNCHGDPYCTEIPESGCPNGIEKNGQFYIGFRAYVEPSTKIGPAFSELVYDRVLKFSSLAPKISSVVISPAEAADSSQGVPPGTPVSIQFQITGADSQNVTWTASVKADDGCGVLTPSTGTVVGSAGVSVELTTSETQKTTLTLFLDAIDAAGRRAKTIGVQTTFK